jgi:2-succinyl-5-enolpyruvyl-6-hydroxy-3-cyclohexene-1-carboxylate synthase
MDLAVAADPGDLGRRLNAAVDQREPWGEWRVAERLARAAIDGVLDGMDEPTEPRTARDVAATADLLVIGSSMPVRDLDWFMAPRDGLSVIGNRGASGIDGFVSTALGVALAAGEAVALCGDLSLLHDQNGFFVNVQGSLNCVFVVVNNDGGGIFSFLAQSRQPGFERLFATPHGRGFEQLAAFHRLGYQRIGRAADLIPAIQAARQAGGVHLLEVPGDRAANVLVHRRIAAAVRAAIPPS